MTEQSTFISEADSLRITVRHLQRCLRSAEKVLDQSNSDRDRLRAENEALREAIKGFHPNYHRGAVDAAFDECAEIERSLSVDEIRLRGRLQQYERLVAAIEAHDKEGK